MTRTNSTRIALLVFALAVPSVAAGVQAIRFDATGDFDFDGEVSASEAERGTRLVLAEARGSVHDGRSDGSGRHNCTSTDPSITVSAYFALDGDMALIGLRAPGYCTEPRSYPWNEAYIALRNASGELNLTIVRDGTPQHFLVQQRVDEMAGVPAGGPGARLFSDESVRATTNGTEVSFEARLRASRVENATLNLGVRQERYAVWLADPLDWSSWPQVEIGAERPPPRDAPWSGVALGLTALAFVAAAARRG